jgi:hypothetical protein
MKYPYYYILFWKIKLNRISTNFINYFKKDNIILFILRDSSNLLKNLLTDNYSETRIFFKIIYQFNSALIFIFIKYISDYRFNVYTYNAFFQI